ncbi:hypothetical protein CRG98_048093 [Punica granatum]|uniref:Reverse transcriptase Ty1/copia-type domain-containing protein n=1 Tax=Punica granatum TaxID=22663 RepID=A0A2I0HIJ4_PUNGR|nr:hypothetical protein CRG98_048093 [Punica granatum]
MGLHNKNSDILSKRFEPFFYKPKAQPNRLESSVPALAQLNIAAEPNSSRVAPAPTISGPQPDAQVQQLTEAEPPETNVIQSINVSANKDHIGAKQWPRSFNALLQNHTWMLVRYNRRPNLISWPSKKQPTVSRSSTEAEYLALAYVVAETLWLHQLISNIGLHSPSPIIAYCDNINATYLAANPVQHDLSKHIVVDYHFVKEKITRGGLLVRYVLTLS